MTTKTNPHPPSGPPPCRPSEVGCRPARPSTTGAEHGLDHPLTPSLRSTWWGRVVKPVEGDHTHQPRAGRQPTPSHGNTRSDTTSETAHDRAARASRFP